MEDANSLSFRAIHYGADKNARSRVKKLPSGFFRMIAALLFLVPEFREHVSILDSYGQAFRFGFVHDFFRLFAITVVALSDESFSPIVHFMVSAFP